MSLVLLFLLCFCGAAGAVQPDERQQLLEQERVLRDREAKLKREQAFLLFQKTMYAADSKYLVLNFSEKTGRLKYKNRVLKKFHFTVAKRFSAGKLQPGMLILTKKIEVEKGSYTLLFGKALVVRERDTAATGRKNTPAVFFTKKDMLSVFFAIEEGATAYVVR
jgi:putative sterol carrier protein